MATMQCIINAWISIAVASRTKKLILSLRSRSRDSPCVFPFQQLLATQGKGEENFLEVFKLKFCDINILATPDFDAFKNLRLLKFTSVNVTDEVVRDLLPRCAALNYLTLVCCRLLHVLEDPSSLCKLQFLKAARCRNLRTVECNAPSVSRFKYQGYEVSLKREFNVNLVGGVKDIKRMHNNVNLQCSFLRSLRIFN